MIYISSLFLFGSAARFINVNSKIITNMLSLAILVLVGFAVSQQLGLLRLPGSTGWPPPLVRPSSLTGSYLHYPIVTAILAGAVIQAGLTLRRFHHIPIGLIGLIGVIASGSRSGVFIIVLCGAFYFLSIFQSTKLNKKADIILIAIVVSVILLMAAQLIDANSIATRIFSIADTEEYGNHSRINAWVGGLELLGDGPIIIGRDAGVYTNITGNLIGEKGGVAESGPIQQALNFGVLGCAAFYALFIALYFYTNKKCRLIRALILAAVFQSFVYQSIEVFPFVALVAFLPALSHALVETAGKAKKKGVGRIAGQPLS